MVSLVWVTSHVVGRRKALASIDKMWQNGLSNGDPKPGSIAGLHIFHTDFRKAKYWKFAISAVD